MRAATGYETGMVSRSRISQDGVGSAAVGGEGEAFAVQAPVRQRNSKTGGETTPASQSTV